MAQHPEPPGDPPGSLESVRAVIAAVERVTCQWNDVAVLFTWVKTPPKLCARRKRLRVRETR